MCIFLNASLTSQQLQECHIYHTYPSQVNKNLPVQLDGPVVLSHYFLLIMKSQDLSGWPDVPHLSSRTALHVTSEVSC